MAKKLKDLEKRVKQTLDEERKKRERQDTEKDRNLQKKLVTLEAGISRSLEVATGIT